jgi:hypothetical protein
MSIPEYARTNFNTLLRPAAAGDLALVECTDAATGEPRSVLAAIGHDDGTYTITPFGHLAPGNPFDAYVPPDASPDAGEPVPE